MFRFKLTDTFNHSSPALRSRIFLALSAAFVIISRLLTISGNLTTPESVNFAFALHNYDIASQSPPLPGFPVYIFLARIFLFFGMSDAVSLVLPGILSMAFSVYPLYNLVKRLHGEDDAKLAVLLYIVNPGLWIISLRPSYSALVLFPFLLALRMFLRIVLLKPHLRHQTRFLSFYTGTIALGILCGITLDSLSLFIPLLLFTFYGLIKLKRTRIMVEMVNGIIVGICLWAIPFFFTVSIADIISHLDSGEIVYASAAPSMLSLVGKVKLFLWDIFAFGFMDKIPLWAAPAPVLMLILAFYLAVRHMRFEYKYFFLLTFFIPYVLLILFYRNLYMPGNLVFLIPMVIVFISAGLATLGKKAFYIVSSILVLVSLIFGCHRALIYKNSSSPQVQLADRIKEIDNPDKAVLFGGGTVRVLRYYAGDMRCYGIASISELKRPFNKKVMKDKSVYLISDINDIKELDGTLSLIGVFPPAPYIFGKSDTLKLYTYSPPEESP